MRIGQLARTYDIPVQDLLDYLEKIGVDAPHPNGKLFESLERQVLYHFGKQPDMVIETSDEAGEIVVEKELTMEVEVETVAVEIARVEGEIEEPIVLAPEPEVPKEIAQAETVSAPKPEEIIETDRLLAMIEAGETPPDLDKIKLIKAPKKELAGLKVLGKVELPEPKKKLPREEKTKNRQPERPQLSEAEKEKRRLAAKKRQQEQEARQEKRRKEKELAEQKARKQAHYLQQVQKAKVEKPKTVVQQTATTPTASLRPERPTPTTIFGKFWRWLNT
jgi:hypothetical protein